MSDTIYSYYKVNVSPDIIRRFGYPKNSKGMICVRIDRPPLGTPGEQKYKVSYAFCSPHDNFSRKIARKICDSRIEGGYYVELYSPTALKARNISERAVNFIHEISKGKNRAKVNSIKIPNWFSCSSESAIHPYYR